MQDVRSSVTEGAATKVFSIKSGELIAQYQKLYGIDVRKNLDGLNEISIYKCADTGYEFFFPFTAAGDDKFYERLSTAEWYYDKTRWEFGAALKFIPEGANVLEIGSGSGSFLDLLQSRTKVKINALEMNPRAIKALREKNYSVSDQTIEEFSKTVPNTFDVVCSFQVLEHVAKVKPFLDAALAVLKPGGKLLIAVPNNDSFMNVHTNAHDGSKYLNMPPHHMGLWDERSLRKLEDFFPVKVTDFLVEPFDERSLEIFLWTAVLRKTKSTLLARAIWKLGLQSVIKRFARKAIVANEPGHTVLAVYEKRATPGNGAKNLPASSVPAPKLGNA